MTCISHSLNPGLVFLDNSFADVDWASEAPQQEEFPRKQEGAHQTAHVAYEYGLGAPMACASAKRGIGLTILLLSKVYRVTEPEKKRHGHNVQYPPVSCKPLELIHG